MDEIVLAILNSLRFIIPQLIIISACIYYLVKKTTADGILLLIGSLLGLFSTIFHTIIMSYLFRKELIDPFKINNSLTIVTGIIGFLGSLAFAIGLLLLIQNVVRVKKNNFKKA